MTLGRAIDEKDDEEARGTELFAALDKLRTVHDFEHLDSSHGRNSVLVPGDQPGTEKLLVIDLESWDHPSSY
jgi:hypothetical protein